MIIFITWYRFKKYNKEMCVGVIHNGNNICAAEFNMRDALELSKENILGISLDCNIWPELPVIYFDARFVC